MVSTMEVESLMKLRQLEPDLRLGWTYPKTRRDWTRYRLASPALATAIRAIRRRFPNTLASQAPALWPRTWTLSSCARRCGCRGPAP